jgi:NADPH-dependent curcumin reductase CurA
MEGFVVVDYMARAAEAIRPLAAWLVEGKLKAREGVAEGLEHLPTLLARLFKGENTAKLVLNV